MNRRSGFSARVAGALALCMTMAVCAQTPRKGGPMMQHVAGPFDVKTLPMSADSATEGTTIGRYALEKQYHGALDGVGKGEMLGAGSPAKGAAGYVAIEEFTGTLQGRKGAFALQHFGVMDAEKVELKVLIVPGSGSGELLGIEGAMTITNEAGKHSYALEYTLPE